MTWKKGAVVMEALPYAHVIMQIFKEERCNQCLRRSETLKKCAQCKKLWYCSQQCQKDDWKIHKAECPILQRVPDLPTDSLRLYLRLILSHQNGRATSKLERSEVPCIRTFNDLESHCEDVKSDKSRWELFQIAADFIRAYTYGLFQCPTEAVMLDIFGKMVINTFTMTDDMLQDVAVGVYNSPSILDHSCCPNAVASFDGRRLNIRLLKDLPEEDYSQVFLSYVDPLALTSERQQQLQCQYYFTCVCDRCKDQGLDGLMSSTEGSEEGDVDRVKECLERMEEMRKDGADSKSQVQNCEECLSHVKLPGTNIYLVRLVGKAFDEAIDAQLWKEALWFGRKNLEPYEKLYPAFNPSLGNFHAHLGKLLVFMEELEEARPMLRKAFEIFLVTLGEGHCLTNQVVELIQQCQTELSLTEG